MIRKATRSSINFAAIGIIAALFLVLTSTVEASQGTPPDTIGGGGREVIYMGDVTVRANRLPLTILEIPAAATSLKIGKIDRTNSLSLGSVVNLLPGVQAYPISNPWGAASINARGFYGGAQADYLMVTYDGIPLNDISSGRVPWNLFPLSDIGSVESIMGPASAQYGDFGFGGLLALYSPTSPAGYHLDFSSSAGSYGAWRAHASMSGRSSKSTGTLTFSKRRNDGWRDHSQFHGENAGFIFSNTPTPRVSLSGILTIGHTYEQYPGALTEEELRRDRTAAADVYGVESPDYADADDFRGSISSVFSIGSKSEAKSTIYITSTRSDEVVTVTRPVRHEPRITSTGADVSYGTRDTLLGRSVQVVAGFHGEYGELLSRYREFDAASGDAIRDGRAFRRMLAAYIHGLSILPGNISLVAGVRVDKLWSDYRTASVAHEQRETAVSPKFAVSAPVRDGVQLYASVTGAFKAPTLVHLYDSPPIYYQFSPDFGDYFSISNDNLSAQTGTCYEIGCKFVDSLSTMARLSLFDYEISDEIDFDPATNRYMNIGKSRHRGVEGDFSQQFLSFMTGAMTLDYNATTFRSGEYSGKQINGVPKFTYNLSLTFEHPRGYFAEIILDGRGERFIDQANTRRLGDYTTTDIAFGVSLKGIDFSAMLRNVFDRALIYDGYVGLMGESRFYPAPGRTLYVSLSTGI